MFMLKVINYFKNNWRLTSLIIVALIFFISCSSFNYFTQKNDFVKWLSPDETANYIFTKLYGQQGQMQLFEKYNLLASDIIRPRSFRSDYGWLKPVSFLGMILVYGKLVSLTSYKVIPYLTPLLAALGIIFYYLLIKRIFGRRIAFVSALLLASFPVYIYYSSRSMFHNVPFMVFLLIGLYFSSLLPQNNLTRRDAPELISTKKIKKINPLNPPLQGGQYKKNPPSKGGLGRFKRIIFAALGGGFIGLAIITRTSELLWLGPVLLILWLFNFTKIKLSKLLIFICFLGLALLPVAYWSQVLYGSWWQGGYPEMNRSLANIGQASAKLVQNTISQTTQLASGKTILLESLRKIKDNIFFFGWRPEQSWQMFSRYFINMFYWLFWLAASGMLIFVFRIGKWRRKHFAYLASWLTTSLILIYYYGSWGFSDNPDPQSFTIGNSYTRYWLPIYLSALPFASLAIIKLTDLFKSRLAAIISRIAIILFIFFMSLNYILIGSEEGLLPTAKRQIIAQDEFNKIINLTEYNSVIISRYHDKLLFPERKVIVGLFDDPNMINEYSKLAKLLPVYYYNFNYQKKDLAYLNNSKLKNYGLRLNTVANIYQNFSLYKLDTLIPNPSPAPGVAGEGRNY